MANDAAKATERATLNESLGMLQYGDKSPQEHQETIKRIEDSGVLTRSEIQETLKRFQSLVDVPEKYEYSELKRSLATLKISVWTNQQELQTHIVKGYFFSDNFKSSSFIYALE